VCTCTAPQIRRYLSSVSGPLLDRIDIHIEVHPFGAKARELALLGEDSKTVRKRVLATRARQARRGPKLSAQAPAIYPFIERGKVEAERRGSYEKARTKRRNGKRCRYAEAT
jgi:magnesium chelatase family protein